MTDLLAGRTEEYLQWWRSYVAEAPPLAELPRDGHRPPALSDDNGRYDSRLAPVAELEAVAASLGVGTATVTVAIVVALLARYGRDSQVVLASDLRGGWLVVLVDVLGEPTFADLVARLETALDAAAHHPVPLPDLADALAAPADSSRAQLAQVVVGFHGSRWPLSPRPDLFLQPGRSEADATISWDFAADLFDLPAVERMAGHLESLALAAIDDSSRSLWALPILSTAERDLAVNRTNDTGKPFPDRCLHDLFADQVAKNPESVAVIFEQHHLTYIELDRRANGLAHHLVGLHVGPDVLVGLCTDRSDAMLVGLLAILKAGGAYVPVDPTYPAERVAMILGDAGVKTIVTQRDIGPTLPTTEAKLVYLDDELGAADVAPPSAVRSDNLAYVIFTSGSTGRPKGVMIEHRAVVNFLTTMADEPGMTSSDRLLAVTTLSFDIAGLELYLPLLTGATVIIASRQAAGDPDAIARAIDEHDVTVMQATPATWRLLIDAGWPGTARLRAWCGGEALPVALSDAVLARVGELWNLYGPTETTIWSTRKRLTFGCPITIGRPIANTQVYVVDAHCQPVPVGVVGELLIGGDGLARGYFGQPALTADRFVPDPFGAAPAGRVYRTGDLVRSRSDGEIEYVGRIDNQVKVRGFRIELGEIETVLTRHDSIAQAVVVVQEDSSGDRQLSAYVVARSDSSPAPQRLRRYVAEHLPAYMVPATLTVLASFPMTPNGKVDRRALPEPDRISTDREAVAPRDELEARLVATWEEVLGISPIGVTDNFFELGVSSLTAARLIGTIERSFDAKLPLAVVFAAPTIVKLAELLRGDHGEAETGRKRFSALVPITTDGQRPPLFCIHGGAGTILLFHPLARRLAPQQPVYGLQAVGLYGGESPQTTIEAMADRYLAEIRTVQPNGPYHLGGYCFGGLVAFEMARRLVAHDELGLLVMFNAASPTFIRKYPNSGPPADDRALKASVRRQLAGSGSHRQRVLQLTAAVGRRTRSIGHGIAADALVRLRRPLPDNLREAAAFQRIAMRAQAGYDPAPFPGSLLVISSEQLYHHVPDLCWSAHVTGNVDVLTVPGDQPRPRVTMREPWVRVVADGLAERLSQFAE